MNNFNVWNMAGTDGTNEYVVVAHGPNGRLGFRDLGGDGYRVRLEINPNMPMAVLNAMRQALNGWNNPEGKNLRFSRMIGREYIKQALALASVALGEKNEYNENNAPYWAVLAVSEPHKYLPPTQPEPEKLIQQPKATGAVPSLDENDDVAEKVDAIVETVSNHVQAFVNTAQSLADELNEIRNK